MPSRPSCACSVLTAIGSSANPSTLIVFLYKDQLPTPARSTTAKTTTSFVHVMLTRTPPGWRLTRRIGRSRRRIIQIQRKLSRRTSRGCREPCLIALASLLMMSSPPTLSQSPRLHLPDQMMDLMTLMPLPETKLILIGASMISR